MMAIKIRSARGNIEPSFVLLKSLEKVRMRKLILFPLVCLSLLNFGQSLTSPKPIHHHHRNHHHHKHHTENEVHLLEQLQSISQKMTHTTVATLATLMIEFLKATQLQKRHKRRGMSFLERPTLKPLSVVNEVPQTDSEEHFYEIDQKSQHFGKDEKIYQILGPEKQTLKKEDIMRTMDEAIWG